MPNIKCPHCGESFTIDEAGYADIVQQVRNAEFDRELKDREKLIENDKQQAIKLAETKAAGEMQKMVSQKDAEIQGLKAQIESAGTAQDLAVQEAVADAQSKLADLQHQLEQAQHDRAHDAELAKAQLETQVQQTAAQKDTEIGRAHV